MIRNLAFAAALFASPAMAQDTFVPPTVFSVEPNETIEQAQDKYRLIRKDAARWETAYQALNIADAVQTCAFLASGKASEANPLFGKHPSCERVVATKAAIGLLQYILFRNALRDDPAKARRIARIGVFIQGAVVGANMRFAF
jgi:hypothetical protein